MVEKLNYMLLRPSWNQDWQVCLLEMYLEFVKLEDDLFGDFVNNFIGDFFYDFTDHFPDDILDHFSIGVFKYDNFLTIFKL